MIAISPREHRLGIAAMMCCALLWSTAGIVTRHASVTNGWEVTFWRSLFCVIFVAAVMLIRDRGGLLSRIAAMGWPGLVSSLCWAAMFTCFMLALTRTTVANTLVVMAVTPFFNAIGGALFLRERVPPRTWLAMLAAAVGVAVMFAHAIDTGSAAGALIALGVPIASTINVITLKRAAGSRASNVSLVPSLIIGGSISAAIAWSAAPPLGATAGDLALFGLLGVFQLGCPCMLYATFVVKRLSAAEIGLLGLLEILCGPLWVWLSVGERPGTMTLAGGAIVLAALVVNEAAGLIGEKRREKRAAESRPA